MALETSSSNLKQESTTEVVEQDLIARTGEETEEFPELSNELREIFKQCQSWMWRGENINFFAQKGGSGPPVLLVHGFAGSIGHWRRTITSLTGSGRTVYAVDLLGFGVSAKPMGFNYTIESWAELLVDFVQDVVGGPVVFVGNSIGSLISLTAAAALEQKQVAGVVLINCAGAMNNKGLTEDWRIRLALPLFLLIDFLLKQPPIARAIFNYAQNREVLGDVLRSVYGNKDAVDDELVTVFLRPARDDGALHAFVSILTGPAGPRPQALLPLLSCPVLILWGDKDPFTPLDGPVGRYFKVLAQQQSSVSFFELPGVGHCPQDDFPALVDEKLQPWLSALP